MAVFHPAPSKRAQRGIAAIEFALVFVMFLSIVYGAASFGAVFYTQQVVSRAAEDGARAISLLGVNTLAANDSAVTAIVQKSLSGSLIAPSSVGTTEAQRSAWLQTPGNVTITIDPTCAGVTGCARVTVAYQYSRNRILPVLPLISWSPNTLIASAVSAK